MDFAYDGLGQFTTIDRYQNTGGSNIVAQTTFAYDDDSRLTDLDHKQSSTTLAGYDYGYDNMGRITSIDSFIEDLSTFTYDKTSQLTGADHTSPRADETYSYDDNGNRTMSGYTVSANNLTTSDGTYDYEYDDEGNRTKRTKISDGSYEVYEWDHRNRLTKITFYDSTDTVLKTVDHTYDLFNRWLRRTTDPDGPGQQSAIDTFFAYDGIEPILQWDGSAASDLTNRYLFGPAVDQILASEDVTSLTSAGNILWPLSDHLGTPRDIADQNESTHTTTVTNHRTFDSFGTLTVETNSSIDLLSGFTGKAFDEDTGVGNHWNRITDHALGQWLSEDPIGFDADGTNLRRYVENDVFNWIDPTGHKKQPPPNAPPKPPVDKSTGPIQNLPDNPDPHDKVYDEVAIYNPWNKGIEDSMGGESFKKIAEGYDTYIPAYSYADMVKSLEEYVKMYGKIDKLVIIDHGNNVGGQWIGKYPITREQWKRLRPYLRDDRAVIVVIVLIGCNVGACPGYTGTIAKDLHAHVYASTSYVYEYFGWSMSLGWTRWKPNGSVYTGL